MFHLEVNGGGKVHIEGGTTNFYGVPILQYETTAGRRIRYRQCHV